MDDTSSTASGRAVEVTDRFAVIPEALLYDASLSADAVRVYGVLLRYGSDPENCYPSHARIAAHIGKSARSVPAWIRELEAAGWVERFARTSPEGDPTSNGYRIHGRAVERGVRAEEQGPLRAGEQGGCAPASAPNESQVNESQVERADGEGALFPLPDPQPGDEPVDETLGVFAALWESYPRRNGKRLGHGDARRAFGRLVPAEQYRAHRNVEHYAAACAAGLTIAMDCHRWLRPGRAGGYQDWDEPAEAGRPGQAQARPLIQDRTPGSRRLAL